jgi:cytochrome c peroxidase
VPNDLGVLSDTGKVSCASCHTPAAWGTDTRSFPSALSLGTSWTTRNSPPITNTVFYDWFYWDGRSDSLWQQALLAGENPLQQASDRLRITRVIYTKYKTEYEAVFSTAFGPLDSRFDPADANAFPAAGKPGVPAYDALLPADQAIVTRAFVNWGKAIEAYERKLVSRNAPWDKFVAGDNTAISQNAIHGYKLFTGKGYCVNCHSGPLFSDSKLHNIGVPNHGGIVDKGRYDTIVKAIGNKFRADGTWSDDPDAGAQKLASQPEFDGGIFPDGGLNFSLAADLGMFRTKHLRQIEHTAPYMHNGSLYSLEDVMELYRQGGGDSGIGTLDKAFQGHVPMTADETLDVIAFLKTLTGEPPPAALLGDTSKP